MSSKLAALLLLAIPGQLLADRIRVVPTELRCEQVDDADQWLEVGVAGSENGDTKIIVVRHDYDDNSARLVTEQGVLWRWKNLDQVILENRAQTIRLEYALRATRQEGTLSMIADGPGSIMNLKMDCWRANPNERQTIRFQVGSN
ncbi:MAG: hypothetical protein RIQ81_475 [Pseudomonadota bacterium]|jgi:hypothetical protein